MRAARNIPIMVLLTVLMWAVLLAGCTAAGGLPSPASTSPNVLAAETFLADIAQNVAGKRLEVGLLVPPGVDPHEFQLAPQDAIKLERCRVLIVNGLEYETWLAESLREATGARLVVVATAGMAPNAGAPGGNGAADPHMWMDPAKVIRYADNIREGLSRADPAGAAIYASNAEVYAAQLRELDGWIREQVARIPSEKRVLVTNHDALRYFADAYGFKMLGAVIPSVTNEASATPQEMAALIRTIRSSGAPAIFLDVSENERIAKQIAAESGAEVVTGLYIETLSAGDGPAPSYIEMMKYDVNLIVKALE